ncbi:ATP-binding protein [Microscilla marina]|uniref:ATPase, AAA family n=1 Tax=Microscilla marina ATCC 23134 TaxID=313606 RepID=A1ZM91_MICM2|nr:ATP-binding protein [Microscilla marina]EAY28623.1 ATPase, AAA family [Microscilla marina ATCC 23134]
MNTTPDNNTVKATTQNNTHILQAELNWLKALVLHRVSSPQDPTTLEGLTLPYSKELPDDGSHYVKLAQRLQLSLEGRLLLILGLARSMDDDALFPLAELCSLNKSNLEDSQHWCLRMIGGHLHAETQTFIPTLKTLLFLLCGSNKIAQQEALLRFHTRHALFLEGIVEMHPLGAASTRGDRVVQDWINHQVFLNPSYLRYFLGGPVPQPEDDLNLPIRLLDSGLTIDDLVLPDKVHSQLQPAIHFIKHGQEFFQREGIRNKFREGFIMLLYGPPGTGKTLTASALGNSLGIKTYQLEVSQVISKYIGETSQNMEKVFAELERAIQWLEGQMCILFIDEADAVMGKRSNVKDSKDRYANMDVSFLLQRLEKFPGLLILATNYERNMDEAFGRRIQTYLHIPLPNEEQRKHLWKNILPKPYAYVSPNMPAILAHQFAMTGGHIQNILKQACLHAASDNSTVLEFNRHLEPYIKSEYAKKNITYTPPRNILTLLQLEPKEYTQYKYWADALPEKISFMPSRLPEYLSKCINLSQNEVVTLMKSILPTVEGSQKSTLGFEPIRSALKKHCEANQIDWQAFAQKMNAFMGNTGSKPASSPASKKTKEKPVDKKTEKAPEEAPKAPPTPQKITPTPPPTKEQNLVPPTSTNNGAGPSSSEYAPPPPPSEYTIDGNRAILNPELATNHWLRFLPEGFSYTRQETPKNLGKFYALTENEIMVTLQLAANDAEKNGSNYIEFTPHISDNLEKLRKKIKKDTLYRDSFAGM